MEKQKEKTRFKHETGIFVPYHILNIEGLGGYEKLLLAHIYSFGKKGCWQSNETLAKMYNTSPGTISRWISKIKKYTYVKCPKGYYRTLWAKSHPEVIESIKLYYRGREISKSASVNLRNSEQEHTQKCVSDCSKSAIRLTQKCATTNKTTNKETITKTIAPPSPLPAGGQPPAALVERREARRAVVENTCRNFGRAKPYQPLNEDEFQNQRQKKIKALDVFKDNKASG